MWKGLEQVVQINQELVKSWDEETFGQFILFADRMFNSNLGTKIFLLAV